jgi:hypothetical protein
MDSCWLIEVGAAHLTSGVCAERSGAKDGEQTNRVDAIVSGAKRNE